MTMDFFILEPQGHAGKAYVIEADSLHPLQQAAKIARERLELNQQGTTSVFVSQQGKIYILAEAVPLLQEVLPVRDPENATY